MVSPRTKYYLHTSPPVLCSCPDFIRVLPFAKLRISSAERHKSPHKFSPCQIFDLAGKKSPVQTSTYARLSIVRTTAIPYGTHLTTDPDIGLKVRFLI